MDLRPLEVLEDVVPVRLLPTVVAEVRGGLARQDADRGRLADPVRPEEADDLALLRDWDPEEAKGVFPVLMDEIFFECLGEADDPNRVERAFADTVMGQTSCSDEGLVFINLQVVNRCVGDRNDIDCSNRFINKVLVLHVMARCPVPLLGKSKT